MTIQPVPWGCLPAGDGPLPFAGDPAPPPLPQDALARPVLVIEDEVMIAWWLETLLEDLGFETVRIAASAAEAVALAAVLKPGLVVSDINLGPGREDGIVALARIAALGPVGALFVSAHAEDEVLARIEAVAPRAPVLRKPVAAADLRAAVVQVLAGPARH